MATADTLQSETRGEPDMADPEISMLTASTGPLPLMVSLPDQYPDQYWDVLRWLLHFPQSTVIRVCHWKPGDLVCLRSL